jgi:hypothetical protein
VEDATDPLRLTFAEVAAHPSVQDMIATLERSSEMDEALRSAIADETREGDDSGQQSEDAPVDGDG